VSREEKEVIKGIFDEYYDEFLMEVLNHPKVRKYIKETKEKLPKLTEHELENNAIDHFFKFEDFTIETLEEIRNKLKEALKRKHGKSKAKP
jgi:hypothetical protein